MLHGSIIGAALVDDITVCHGSMHKAGKTVVIKIRDLNSLPGMQQAAVISMRSGVCYGTAPIHRACTVSQSLYYHFTVLGHTARATRSV